MLNYIVDSVIGAKVIVKIKLDVSRCYQIPAWCLVALLF